MPDERVAAAIAHWAPRFVANGVDMNDFRRVSGAVETWEEWLPAWVTNGDMHARLAQEAEALGRRRTAGYAWGRAALSYHFGKFVWMLDERRHRTATLLAVEALRSACRHLDPTAARFEIPYGEIVLAANLRRPPASSGRRSWSSCRASTRPRKSSSLGRMSSCRAGWRRCRSTGRARGRPGSSSNIEPAYESAVTAALDHLELHPRELDLARIGVAGVSLGGYYAARAAAYEKRIEAAVGISGPFDFGACWETMPRPTRETLMHATGATDEEEARAKAWELNLYEAAGRIEQPFPRDRRPPGTALVPWEQTKRQADEAPGGEFVLFDDGSHVCNNIPYLYRPLAADWLAERLA